MEPYTTTESRSRVTRVSLALLISLQPPPRAREPLTLAGQVGEGEEEEEGHVGQGEQHAPDAVDEARVEPLHVPGLGVAVEHLVTDGGDGEQHGGAHRDGQGEGAAPQRDLVYPEVRGVGVGEKLLILLSPSNKISK